MLPEQICSEYTMIMHGLGSAVTDPALLKQIWETSDDFFRKIALSIWKSIDVTPSPACLETYDTLYLEWNSKPEKPDLRTLQAAIKSAPDLCALPPVPYLDDLITFDLQHTDDDETDLGDLLTAIAAGTDAETQENQSPCSLSFLTQCATLCRHLAEILQEPCPTTTLSQIAQYWESLHNYCTNRGVVLPMMTQLKQIMQAQNEITEMDMDRLPYIMSSTSAPNDEVESQRLDMQNREQMAQIETAQANEKEQTLDELLDQLHALCGLDRVKKEVQNQIARVRMQKLREKKGKRSDPISLHMAFLGNPGTGKTTVARLIGKLYHAIGILSEGQLVEVDRSGLVAEYIGHTEKKTQAVINRAMGDVLFIDEAYALANRGDNDFGNQAIEVLLKNMEDRRENLLVIVAGYPEPMKQFIRSNPGLESRFKNIIHFEDYNGTELMEIFRSFCENNDYIITPPAADYALAYFNQLYARRGANFGNARDARNFYERVLTAKAVRELSMPDDDCDDEITIDDVRAAIIDTAETSL